MNHLISLASLLATPSSTDSLRDLLALHSERWFIGVFAFGFVVALGCVAEAPETRATWVRWRRARAGLPLAPEDEKSWHKPAAAIGLLFVIVGIVGETICEGYVSIDETSIRAIDERNLADSILKAGAAKDSAQAASIAAERASSASDGAVLSSSTALITASAARKEADSFEKDIVSAKDAAARAEEKLADRTLSDDQQKELAIKLTRFAGQEYTVTAYWESPESLGLANRIHFALNDLGKWKYNPVGSKSMMMGGQVGIFIWRHPDADPDTKLAASSLVSALQSDGLKAEERIENPTNNPKNNLISINVGSKR